MKNEINRIYFIFLADETSVDSPRRSIVEPLKPVVSHTREQVLQLSHDALNTLYNQNTDFSTRSTINRTIPDSYFNTDQEGRCPIILLPILSSI